MSKEIIAEAREFYKKSMKSNEVSHIWHKNLDALTLFIEQAETAEELEEFLAGTDFYAIRPSSPEIETRMLTWYKEQLAREGWTDSFSPENPNTARMLMYCLHIKAALQPKTIVELGGGNGQFALMANTFGCHTHIDIDLPESLYMAYVNVRNKMPKARCLWLVEGENTNFNRYEWDFIFCPVGMESVLQGDHFDIFVNTASLGELSNGLIEYWMDFVQNRLKVDYLYTVNRFLNTVRREDIYDPKTYSGKRLNENKASVLFDDKWDILHWELDPAMCRCPFEDSRIARYVEIIAKRQFTKVAYAHDLEYLKAQDWWRFRNDDYIGSNLSNQLNHDLTPAGPLYKLWDEIRLSPTQEAIRMMLIYLRFIGKPGLAFEEEFFYHDLYKKLYEDKEAFFHKGVLC